MKHLRLLSGIVVVLFLSVAILHAQTASPQKGAAEKSRKGWPYPEPAVPGATGFKPDYSEYTGLNERWDIYINLLWRKIGSRRSHDAAYYGEELSDFMRSMPSRERATLVAAEDDLTSLMTQIRANAVTLPYRDAASGCLLFLVRRERGRDLAADDCRGR